MYIMFTSLRLLGFRHQEYVGGVSYVSVDQSAKSNRGIVVASEKGVLAVLSPGDGSISKSHDYHMTMLPKLGKHNMTC